MSIHEVTQRLLAQSEELSCQTNIAGPRFHDFLRIYLMQNNALRGLCAVTSSNGAVSRIPNCEYAQYAFQAAPISPGDIAFDENKIDELVPHDWSLDDDCQVYSLL